MAYPQLKNKHLDASFISPATRISEEVRKLKLPSKWIITYDFPSIDSWIQNKYKVKKVEISRSFTSYIAGNVGFVKCHGFGSSYTTMMIEELIELGGKTFINIGTAGGLNKWGLFVCTSALIDEGTSYHYISPKEKFVYPNNALVKKISTVLKKDKIDFSTGATWTVDAPYRETLREVKHYTKKGISTVEMEASALFSLGRYRKVSVASIFAVRDVLKKDYEIMKLISIMDMIKQAIDVSYKVLKSL